MRQLLLDVAARVFIPVTAVDDCDGEPCAHSFMAAALGRLLLEVLCNGDGACLAFPCIAQTIIRLTENILTRSSVSDSSTFRLGKWVRSAACRSSA
ncbi:hypothetical protein [Streptomyces sp. NPDC058045]|uniref:hypothetical protein n=1 Tax=Streptomyces sp. NPDC058045 TaxID=3346311 RepID=UPI0036E6E2B8